MDMKKQVESRLIKGDIQMKVVCFNEYYFIIHEGVIKPVHINAKDYFVGGDLPVKGKTYEFPDDFNIIDLHLKLVAKIRKRKLIDIVPENEFKFVGIPSVNIMGSGIRIETFVDYEAFKKHFSTVSPEEREKLAGFANRWLDISGYRNFKYL